jgi:hypothetical protein
VAHITVDLHFSAFNHTKAVTHPGNGKCDSIMTEQTEQRARIADQESAQIPQSSEAANAGSSDPSNFEKEVHTWNPTLPMWRRSNKE